MKKLKYLIPIFVNSGFGLVTLWVYVTGDSLNQGSFLLFSLVLIILPFLPYIDPKKEGVYYQIMSILNGMMAIAYIIPLFSGFITEVGGWLYLLGLSVSFGLASYMASKLQKE
jgi:hypothetical protein